MVVQRTGKIGKVEPLPEPIANLDSEALVKAMGSGKEIHATLPLDVFLTCWEMFERRSRNAGLSETPSAQVAKRGVERFREAYGHVLAQTTAAKQRVSNVGVRKIEPRTSKKK